MSQVLTCNQTLSISAHRVFANDLNEHNTVYGGRLLHILDGAASISASRVARSTTVTASIDQVNFIAPFHLHDSLCVESYVTGVGKTSIEVFSKIIGERLSDGKRFLGLTAFSTFVLVDAKQLPQVTPVTSEQQYLCDGYLERKNANLIKRQQQQTLQSKLLIDFPWQ